jgi:hypothetical protein
MGFLANFNKAKFSVKLGFNTRALGLKILRVQGKGGRTDLQSGTGRPAWSDWPRPISACFGRPFTPVDPQVIMHFAPSTCRILMMSSSRPRWRFSVVEVWSFTLQSPGVFLRSTSVLATIGSDFINLMNMNKTRKCSCGCLPFKANDHENQSICRDIKDEKI